MRPHDILGKPIKEYLPNGKDGEVFYRLMRDSMDILEHHPVNEERRRRGLRPANCVGVADSDYRGEYIVALHNDSDEVRTVCDGDRIAQLVIMPFLEVDFVENQELDKTERGDGGFGSTGK